MFMRNREVKTGKLLGKIIVSLLVVVAVAAIWMVKSGSPDIRTSERIGENTDFMLETATIDLDALKVYNLPIIIDFGADSCIPCKEMAPVLKKLNAEMQGKAVIKFVDVWENKNGSKNFPVQIIPTQVLINPDGTPYVPSYDMGIKFNMYNAEDSNEHVFTTHQGGLSEEEMRGILADMGIAQ